MLDFIKPSYWFNKSASALAGEKVRAEQMARFNAILGCDPDRIASAVTSFSCGYLGGMARIIEEFERRDDKMATCSMKMKASVGRCDYQVLVKEGFEKDPRAQVHADILKRFWSTVRVTDRFRMNEAGGVRLLKKQMMDAQSYGFAVHEIVWTPAANGEIRAEFIKMPLWHFENKTGSLRFLRDVNESEGVDMTPGEWLVTTGDGIGIAASIVAMAKHLSFQDWLLFSERSGMPIIIGKTDASFGSDQWNRLKGLIASIYRDTRALVDSSTSIEAIQTGNATNLPFPALVEWADRAIASLYRGADLSTISKGDGTGASLQGDESGMLEQDAVANLGEALHEQVDKFVIRYVTGDDEPLAYISIEPVQKEDVDTDIKIDNHLANLGVKLSKRDALQRYGRVEAEAEDDALEPKPPQPQPGMQGAFGGLPNEETVHAAPSPRGDGTDFQNPAGQVKAAGRRQQGQDAGNSSEDVLKAFARDTGPAADAIKALLQDPSKEAAKAILCKLDTLLPDDPHMAAVIAEAMAKQFSIDGRARAPREPQPNKLTNEGEPTHCPEDGGWIGDAGCTNPNHKHSDTVNKIIEAATNKKPRLITEGDAEKALTEGFYVDVGNGKRIGFGKSLLKHLDEDHPEEQKNDIRNRKNLLMFAVDAVMHPSEISLNEEGHKDRKAYKKAFRDFGIKAISSEEGDKIEYVFTYIPDGRKGTRK